MILFVRCLIGAIALICAALFAMAFWGAYVAAAESPQNDLMFQAKRLLDEHREKHGKYPESLDLLPFTFHGDGQPSTLPLLHYKSDGRSFELVTTGVASGREIRVSRPAD